MHVKLSSKSIQSSATVGPGSVCERDGIFRNLLKYRLVSFHGQHYLSILLLAGDNGE